MSTAPETLLDVRDLRTYFRSGGAHGQGGRRRQLRRAARREPRHRRRVRLGKSVTSLSIMRLIDPPGFIAGGEILFRGRDLAGALASARCARCAATRHRHGLPGPDDRAEPGLHASATRWSRRSGPTTSVSKREARGRARSSSSTWSASRAPEQRVDDYPHQLSGGMRQRVMIAMALANEPDLLIARRADHRARRDDPGADPRAGARTCATELSTAVLLITHDIGVVAEMCDEVAVMYGGRVDGAGRRPPAARRAKHPYSRALLASIPQAGHARAPPAGDRRVRPEPAGDAARLPVRAALPARHASVCVRDAAAEDRSTTASQVACWLYEADDGQDAASRRSPLLEVRNLRNHFPVVGGAAAAAGRLGQGRRRRLLRDPRGRDARPRRRVRLRQVDARPLIASPEPAAVRPDPVRGQDCRTPARRTS